MQAEVNTKVSDEEAQKIVSSFYVRPIGGGFRATRGWEAIGVDKQGRAVASIRSEDNDQRIVIRAARAAWPQAKFRVAPGTELLESVEAELPTEETHEAPPSPPAAAALPWVRVTRDPKRYEERLAQARAIGPLGTPRKVYDLLAPVYAEEDQEVLLAVLLDVRLQLRGVAEVHRGSRSRTEVNVADVLRVAIVEGAEALIVCHNHPSGRADPSAADEELTKAIRKAANALRPGVNFLDHVIIGSGEFYSFEERKVTKVKR